MMLLRATFVVFVTVIGVTCSQKSLYLQSSQTSAKETSLEYRPWIHDATSTSWVSLEGMGVSSINSVLQLIVPDLKWFVMDNNNIGRIPSNAFKFLPNLTYVSLANNKIDALGTDSFNYLKNLQVLDLDGNPINENLDGCKIFGALTALERLYLRNCRLLSFDLYKCMGNLTHLYLSSNRIQAFFATSESGVTHLYLNNNELWHISLSQFKSLVYLDLSGNWLDQIIPRSQHSDVYSSAKQFYRTDYYDDYNGQSRGLFLNDAPALEYLDLSSNKISILEPDSFLGTERLIHVNLTYNRIDEIYHSTFSNLLQLEEILLDSNVIKKIQYRAFVNLPNLKIISLKNNEIVDVSEDAFTKLNSNAPDLHLFLDNNRIHTLKRGSFMGINGLKHVGLSNNRIKTISSQTFVNLPNLESVIIENQSYDENGGGYTWNRPLASRGIIESDAFFNLSNLTSLIIRGNIFAVVESQAFHALPALTILDLSNNTIRNLSPTAFNDLPTVENLHLENNLISEIGPETLPKQLKRLNLANNPLCGQFRCWHIEELYQLEKLDVSGIVERFKIIDVEALPENLTVIVGRAEPTGYGLSTPSYHIQ